MLNLWCYAEGFQNYQNPEITIHLKQIHKLEVLFALKTLKLMFSFFLRNHYCLKLCFKVRAEILTVRALLEVSPSKTLAVLTPLSRIKKWKSQD